jgi:hypothetical protein
MGFLQRAILAVLDTRELTHETKESGVPRESGSKRNDALTLERAFSAISIDLHEYLRAMRDLVEEVKEIRKRNEQVCGWLAHLQEDLRKALRPDAADVRELLILKRSGMRTADLGEVSPTVMLPGDGKPFGSTPVL